MPVSDDTCPGTFIFWREEGDSVEARCRLEPDHHGRQHEAEVDGEAGWTDDDITVETKALVVWPLEARVKNDHR